MQYASTSQSGNCHWVWAWTKDIGAYRHSQLQLELRASCPAHVQSIFCLCSSLGT